MASGEEFNPGPEMRLAPSELLGNRVSVQSVQLLSCVRLFATPWTAAYQAPPSMGFSRQEYWSGLPLPSPKPMLTSTHFAYFLQNQSNRKTVLYLRDPPLATVLHPPVGTVAMQEDQVCLL